MTSVIHQLTLDVQDVRLQAEFWSEALGYEIEWNEEGSTCHLVPRAGSPLTAPTIWLQVTGEPKAGKNRAHPDLRPRHGDVDAEVRRLCDLGAVPVDVGQSPDDPFVVLADPEGNEFCVLRNPQH